MSAPASQRASELAEADLPRALICVGASAGGIDPLRAFVAALAEDLPAAVLVVVHFPPGGESALDKILGRASALTALRPHDRERMLPGRVYVAPPDRHLLVGDGMVRVTHGPRENALRPAVDPLFRSAAKAYGPNAIAVVLSGTGSDGAAGAAEIKANGGRVLVQDPEEALYTAMPLRTIELVEADAVLGASALGAFASSIVEESTTDVRAVPMTDDEPNENGRASGFTCPECGGALWEHGRRGSTRYVCRVGHAYVPETLASLYESNLEDVLWSSIRAFEERADLSRRLAERMERAGNARSAARFRERVEESEQQANALRGLVLRGSMEADIEEA